MEVTIISFVGTRVKDGETSYGYMVRPKSGRRVPFEVWARREYLLGEVVELTVG